MKPACKDCQWWDKDPELANNGWCRIEPPRVFKNGVTVWPQTADLEWCAEFSERTEEDADC